MKNYKLAWWIAGITSAVACKIAINEYDNVRLVYEDTGSAHPDNERFMRECEEWYGQKIETIKSKKYSDVHDVCQKQKIFNIINQGAACTYQLKKIPRYDLEDLGGIENQIFGFEFSKHELMRAKRFKEQYPYTNPLFPLQDKHLTKPNCRKILEDAGIEIPAMYKLGYHNNNCMGCIKGGMGYWNKIRIDFPETFEKFSKLEREVVKHSIIKGVYLDELDPNRGDYPSEIEPECGLFCELEALNI